MGHVDHFNEMTFAIDRAHPAPEGLRASLAVLLVSIFGQAWLFQHVTKLTQHIGVISVAIDRNGEYFSPPFAVEGIVMEPGIKEHDRGIQWIPHISRQNYVSVPDELFEVCNWRLSPAAGPSELKTTGVLFSWQLPQFA